MCHDCGLERTVTSLFVFLKSDRGRRRNIVSVLGLFPNSRNATVLNAISSCTVRLAEMPERKRSATIALSMLLVWKSAEHFKWLYICEIDAGERLSVSRADKTLQWFQVFIIKQQSVEVKNKQQSIGSPVRALNISVVCEFALLLTWSCTYLLQWISVGLCRASVASLKDAWHNILHAIGSLLFSLTENFSRQLRKIPQQHQHWPPPQ